jgi:hypothetical protein
MGRRGKVSLVAMAHHSYKPLTLLCLTIGLTMRGQAAPPAMTGEQMSGHMYMTALRPSALGDREKAEVIWQRPGRPWPRIRTTARL